MSATIALLGQPNSGKSTVFNALTGLKQHVGNWPGKTVEKTHAEASQSLVSWYGYDFARMMTKNVERITLSDIDAICYACCHYNMKVLTTDQQSRLHLEYGEKDFDLKLSKSSLPKYLPNVKPVIRKGYPHCGYMAAHTKEYVEEIESFLKGM